MEINVMDLARILSAIGDALSSTGQAVDDGLTDALSLGLATLARHEATSGQRLDVDRFLPPDWRSRAA
ncbi:hypothetical protein GWK16_16365 [Roseomonas sp. JC162]|uniref:Uncharacterized protein n=1 Tax=Neoroseomonas marina TaxID=1232220 RepID=A0A848EEA2_9PROT|nr:hypothetical protein [Neoroseomonas marina]NMJ42821.1 hypothetical protein [Neoroseomonas marina]